MTLPQQPVSLMGRDPDVLTTAEVATRLGLSAQTVRRMAHARQLPALKTGKDFRYPWTAGGCTARSVWSCTVISATSIRSM
jgi:excisionase family DNA binding protein